MNQRQGRDSRPAGPQTDRDFLDTEAQRVAWEMAVFQDECTHMLRGEPVPLRRSTDRRNQSKLRFSPFYYYPFLFASAFPSVSIEQLRSLALANRVLLEAILLADQRIDETRPWTPEDFFLVDRYYQRSLEKLLPLFPLEHDFWQETQRWFLQHGRAILKEQRRHRHRLFPYSLQEFYEIATGKAALIRTNLLALSWLEGKSDPLAPLMESQDRFLVGFQCFDDLRDWKQDLHQANFTFLLTRILFEGGLHDRVRRGDFPSRAEVGQVLYYRGIAEDQLRLAERYFQVSLDFAKGADVPAWVEVVRGFLRHCHTMRHDLAEIRRRTTATMNNVQQTPDIPPSVNKGVAPEPAAACVKKALLFLLRSDHPVDGYPLARSACPYMNPYTAVAPSRLVTSLILSVLAPLEGLEPGLAPLLARASGWLDRRGKEPMDPDLPIALEESLPPASTGGKQLAELDEALTDALPQQPYGLFWANLLHTACKANICLPNLESLVKDTVDRSDYVPWTHFCAHGSSVPARARGACRPLVPLSLFCQALGPKLPQKPLQTYLFSPYRVKESWNNPTEAALRLLCLLHAGYEGPELYAGVERLILTQEADGSWPANAFYEQDDLYYGSRELTTVWCLMALFLYCLDHSAPQEPHGSQGTSKARTPDPGVFVHADLRNDLHGHAASTLTKLRNLLSPRWPDRIYVGHWPAMPPHFLLNTVECLSVGVNLLKGPENLPLSTSQRPLEVEIVMGVLAAHRCRMRGALRDRLERIYVAGLALWTCGTLWPGQPPWQQMGMRKLDWSWCREHETFLWEELKRFLLHPFPKLPVFQWLLPDRDTSPACPIPRGGALFLGKSLFEQSFAAQDLPVCVNELLCKALPEIVCTFRRKAGLESGENRFD
jgi:hypothetical protein